MPSASLITVSFNSFRCLQRLRQSLLEHTPEDYRWIICDNGSSRRDTHRELDDIERSGEAVVIRSPKNLWFTRGCNLGIEKAVDDSPVVLLNPDCAVKAGWLSEMLETAALPQVGIVGAVLVNERDVVVHAGAYGPGDHEALGLEYSPTAPWAQRRRLEGGWVTGACMLITRPALTAVGGKLDEKYRHFMSDRALCNSVVNAGLQVWMSAAKVMHSVGGSSQ